jgi:type II secretory pathway component PulJ
MTLMEVVVAMSIFAVGVVGLLGVFTSSLRAYRANERREQAAEIAQRELSAVVAGLAEATEGGEGREGVFSWKCEVQPRTEGLTLATVEVRWQERGRAERFELSELYFARRQETTP